MQARENIGICRPARRIRCLVDYRNLEHLMTFCKACFGTARRSRNRTRLHSKTARAVRAVMQSSHAQVFLSEMTSSDQRSASRCESRCVSVAAFIICVVRRDSRTIQREPGENLKKHKRLMKFVQIWTVNRCFLCAQNEFRSAANVKLTARTKRISWNQPAYCSEASV